MEYARVDELTAPLRQREVVLKAIVSDLTEQDERLRAAVAEHYRTLPGSRDATWHHINDNFILAAGEIRARLRLLQGDIDKLNADGQELTDRIFNQIAAEIEAGM
jgi:uncharacterized small protein (DUF1192 family)